MGAEVEEEHMATGRWSADVTWSPSLYDELTEVVGGKRRVRLLHVLVHDPDGDLIYIGVLRKVAGGRRGLAIGGPGMLYHLGDEIGPLIVDREYVSGESMVNNGGFASVDRFWRRPSQASGWAYRIGYAFCTGALGSDDILEPDQAWPTEPGKAYRAAVAVARVIGTQMRIRTLYEGKFDPPNMLFNGDFNLGPAFGWGPASHIAMDPAAARSGAYGLRLSAIPKPQLVAESAFASGWTLPPEMAVLSDPALAFGGASTVLACAPNPKPVLMNDVEATVWETLPPDIAVALDPAHSLPQSVGDYVLRVGPNIQHQVLKNADFGSGFDYWYQSSTDGDPDPVANRWIIDPTGGNNGGPGARTVGWSTGGASSGPLIKYLRADKTIGGVDPEPYDVKPGDTYRVEAYMRGAPGTEGHAYVSAMMPHPTNPAHHTWLITVPELDAPPHDDMRWAVVSREFTVPEGRTKLNILVEVHNHGLGYWYADTVTVTRIRGNQSTAESLLDWPIEANTTYRISGAVLADDDHTDGSLTFGVKLRGLDMVEQEHDITARNNDYQWKFEERFFTPSDGYATATPFITATDITGGPLNLDFFKLEKWSGNTATGTGASFPVVADQRYLLSVSGRPGTGVTAGRVSVGVTLTGPGMAPQEFAVDFGSGADEWVANSTEVTPPPGYDTATPFVRSTDVEGGIIYVGRLEFIKMDNNTDSIVATPLIVTPERTYRMTVQVRSSADLQRGSVQLVAVCRRDGSPDQRFPSGTIGLTGEGDGETWETLTFDVTPPSGYDVLTPSIVGLDIEGGYIDVDEGELRDADATTVAFDAAYSSDIASSVSVDSVAPAGAEFVRVQVVAEQGASVPLMTGVSLVRIGVPLATGDGIMADLLTDPTTGEPLSIAPGVIDCPEGIPHDWNIERLTLRGAVEAYASVVSTPRREYRLNYIDATSPPTMDMATAEALCTDHAPGSSSPVVFREKDLDVNEVSDLEIDAETRPTHVTVVGATIKTVSGQDEKITATAEVPGAKPEYDWNNRPVTRTKPVEDTTVDHFDFAAALAEHLALKEASPAISFSATLSEMDDGMAELLDVRARPDIKLGDWCYVPTASAAEADDTDTIEGETVYLRRVRLWSRHRRLGPGHRMVMRRADGSLLELPVTFEEANETTLELGDRPIITEDERLTTFRGSMPQ